MGLLPFCSYEFYLFRKAKSLSELLPWFERQNSLGSVICFFALFYMQLLCRFQAGLMLQQLGGISFVPCNCIGAIKYKSDTRLMDVSTNVCLCVCWLLVLDAYTEHLNDSHQMVSTLS